MPPRSAPELWQLLRAQAEAGRRDAPALAAGLTRALLQPVDLTAALVRRCAEALAEDPGQAEALAERFAALHAEGPALTAAACADLEAVLARDPAYASLLEIFLFSKGFLALQTQRLSHALWCNDERLLALHLQVRCNRLLAIDIHPAARLGRGIMLDHGTGIVIGETAVVEDDVSILQQVTLGGTGKEQGDRHPKVRRGVMIGAGVKILGNLEIGEGAKIGANSVVLHPVAPHTTVVGIPARPVGRPRDAHPAESMDQSFDG
ncbi:MAG: serine O-acetyltransferase [Pseudomonas sp. PGPPP4]|uniref:serine O-acetyltransferase n=1 Tax=Pseudomonas sp. PGPPP4 TaxID=2015556 RepID=UPI000BD84BF7|nr:serine O-acetyltransferase [Pseudomonas sp. PGPPP4]OYT85077.1 MAG: serine O-acetyltransferase [Pseudomonas sp. PGPPP4]